jgi:serine/threonine-protein phosphatase 2A regulatory subunit B''
VYKIRSEFEKLPGKCVIAKNDMSRITKACGLPLSWKEPLRQAVIANRHPSYRLSEPVDVTRESKITCDEFLEFWRNILSSHFDEASRVVAILSRGQRKYLVPEDFISMIQDVVECHPGLTFLKEAIEFHSRYVHTVTMTLDPVSNIHR